MNKIKKIIGVVVVTMFLLALIPNFSYVKTAFANPQCLGWDGVTPYCGVVDLPEHVCIIEAECNMVCYKGCD